MSDQDQEQILTLHKAKYIIDNSCFIYKKEVLDHLAIGMTVRISLVIDTDLNLWSHDSPYVNILYIKGNEVLGQIADKNRQSTYKYPLSIGENIWFKKVNIIEVLDPMSELKRLLTIDRVEATGPLFTIEYDDFESNSSDSSENLNDSDEVDEADDSDNFNDTESVSESD